MSGIGKSTDMDLTRSMQITMLTRLSSNVVHLHSNWTTKQDTRIQTAIPIFGLSHHVQSLSTGNNLSTCFSADPSCLLYSLSISSPCSPSCVSSRCSTCLTCSSPGWSRPRPRPPPSRRSCSLRPTSSRGTTTTTWCERRPRPRPCDRGANRSAARLPSDSRM